jgi:hypothetical protein
LPASLGKQKTRRRVASGFLRFSEMLVRMSLDWLFRLVDVLAFRSDSELVESSHFQLSDSLFGNA